jgi:hypothetical protein
LKLPSCNEARQKVDSFEFLVITTTTLVVCAETDDPSGRRGNTVQIVARCWRLVAYNVAQDILHQAMFSVLQWWIKPVKEVHLFAIVNLLLCITLAK